jgi:hypothetical protein
LGLLSSYQQSANTKLDETKAMGNTNQLKGHRWVGKVVFVVLLSILIAHNIYSDSLQDSVQGQNLTLDEYIQGFDAHKAKLKEPPAPLWAYLIVTFVGISLSLAFYELAGIGFGRIGRRILNSAPAESHLGQKAKMYTAIEIPDKLQARVNGELEPGEVIRWIERPVPRYFTPKAKAAFLFGIPWTAFAIFWTLAAAGQCEIPESSKGIVNIFRVFPLFGIPFILIGLGLLSSPLWAYRKALKTVYVITDRRAITFDGGRSNTVRSYPPSKLRDIYRKDNEDGTGDVIISVLNWRNSEDQPHIEELGFINIQDPRRVEDMLKRLAEQKPAVDRW